VDHANASWPVNNCLFVDQESLELGNHKHRAAGLCISGSPITFEDEITLGANRIDIYTDNQNYMLKLAKKQGTKVRAGCGNLHRTISGVSA
jgi:hypothetical protein